MGVVCSQGPSQSEANMSPSHGGGPFVPLHSKAFHTPPVHDEIGTHKQDMGTGYRNRREPSQVPTVGGEVNSGIKAKP